MTITIDSNECVVLTRAEYDKLKRTEALAQKYFKEYQQRLLQGEES